MKISQAPPCRLVISTLPQGRLESDADYRCRHAQRAHVATYVADGFFSEVMVNARDVTFIKNELFLLYSQVIIKECVYGYRSSVENGQRTYFGE